RRASRGPAAAGPADVHLSKRIAIAGRRRWRCQHEGRSMNRTGLIAVLSMVVQLSHAQPQTVDRTVAAQPRGQVVITNVAGDIQIQGWDRDEVRVRGELDRGVKTLEVTAAGERTLINVVPERGRDHAAARLSLQVPRHSAL